MAYEIEGRLLEVCTCNVLCPCWVGEDPDYKTCDTTIAWGIEKGSIEGVDVNGLTMAVSAHIPKNILDPEVVEGRRVRRRPGDRRAGGRAAAAVHRAARWRGRRPRRPHRRGRRRRARADHVHRRGRQGPDLDRLDRRGRDGAVRRRDRQARRPSRRRSSARSRARPSTRARRASTRATAARTASRASISRTTTPSRATSASRPDAGARRVCHVHARTPARSRAATGRSSAGTLVALAVAAWLALWLWEGSPYRAVPPPRRQRRPARARGGALLARLGADDRGDDAAVEHPAGDDLRGARPPAPAPGAARRCCCSLGYLLVWGAFGLAAWLADRGVHAAVDALPWLAEHPAAHHRRPRSPPPGCGSSARCGTAASRSAEARSAS